MHYNRDQKLRRIFLAAILLGVLSIFAISRLRKPESHSPSAEGGGRRGGGRAGGGQAGMAARPPVAVVITEAKKGDIGVAIQALGTVTPVHTVNVVSRVPGQISKIFYREGEIVKRGDPLVEIDPRPYEAARLQAEGTLLHDEAALKEARIDLARYRKAWAQNAIAKQQLDDQVQLVHQDEGSVKADQGALETARLNVGYCHITSPMDGRVGLRLVDPGNMIQADSTTTLVVITQLRPMTVIFSVAEDFLPQIQEQLKIGSNLRVELYDREQTKKIAVGAFETLDNQIDTTTGTVRIRAVFQNEDLSLFPNQFVNAKLLISTERDATLVASTAIQRGAQGPFVYVIDPDHTAHLKRVKLGAEEGGVTAVQGIDPGDAVANAGFDKLQEGAKVTLHEEKGVSTQQAGAAP